MLATPFAWRYHEYVELVAVSLSSQVMSPAPERNTLVSDIKHIQNASANASQRNLSSRSERSGRALKPDPGGLRLKEQVSVETAPNKRPEPKFLEDFALLP